MARCELCLAGCGRSARLRALMLPRRRKRTFPPRRAGRRASACCELVAKVLAIDPSFAPAYVVRARTRFGFFTSNLDVSDTNLEGIRSDLDMARRLSKDKLIGLDVRAAYAAHVDLDPDEGLRLTALAPQTSEVLKTRAGILMTLGRHRESNETFDRVLALDATQPRSLRGKVANLLAEGRSQEAVAGIEALREIAPAWANPGANVMTALDAEYRRPSLEDMRQRLHAVDPKGEGVVELWSELNRMGRERRYEEIRELLDGVRAESLRVPTFVGPMPGLGRMPVAALRGWYDLLRDDAAAAAASGRDVLDFVAAERATKWNAWHLRMLEAEGRLLLGDRTAAAAAVRDSLQLPLTNVFARLYRDYLAAITLAWAGEHGESVILLESLSDHARSYAPTLIARNPRLSVPLAGNARFGKLRSRLETEMAANRIN